MTTALNRFFSKLDILPGSECILWNATKRGGYGRLRVGGKLLSAHRFIYKHSEGKIPEGMEIDHICRNPSCVNTSHLRTVPHRTNCLENSVSIPAVNKLKTYCHRGHPFDTVNTYPLSGGRRGCRECKRIADKTMTEEQLVMERERNRRWREKHKGYFQAWRERHPEYNEIRRQKYHAKKISVMTAR